MGSEAKLTVKGHLRRQLRVISSWTMSIQSQHSCAQFVVERGLDLDRLFTHHWSLDQAEEAYREFDMQSSGKGVFLM